jgi:hypothetical protein
MDISIFETSFWKVHPEMTFAPKLDKLYKDDMSKDQADSSRIMWAISLCETPSSKFYNRPGKYEEMSATFLKSIIHSWKKLAPVIDSFKDSALTDAERALTSWNETIKMRDKAIKELYETLLVNAMGDLDTKALADVDRMLALTPKLFDDYNKIKQTFEEEKIHKKGKSTPSLSDEDAL